LPRRISSAQGWRMLSARRGVPGPPVGNSSSFERAVTLALGMVATRIGTGGLEVQVTRPSFSGGDIGRRPKRPGGGIIPPKSPSASPPGIH
jgi:hypothetical protein